MDETGTKRVTTWEGTEDDPVVVNGVLLPAGTYHLVKEVDDER